ncbi:hypothetical protein SAMN05443668_103265 [Cryptosporangium aurantiacum]|uniref:Uncharacterized protein n=1 Tax=Cryptosporangium aurantiacum TaxID=134849 RepID=A0A1M7PEA2_9ACTN|nr:hypothetical protein SAMN05443668_103265 [Cryptosporangium aurantiacum]
MLAISVRFWISAQLSVIPINLYLRSPSAELGTQLRVIGIMRLWGPLAASLVAVVLLVSGLARFRQRNAKPAAHAPKQAASVIK